MNRLQNFARGRLATAYFIRMILFFTCSTIYAAGTLSPGNGVEPMKIRNHNVSVLLNNGFAKVEVNQTFHNQHASKMEAIYSFPLPKSASMSEMQVRIGENVIEGEVLAKEKAREVYEEEKSCGNDAGLAEKNGYEDFRFKVANIPANSNAEIRFVYYQPLDIDTGMGRFLYPLENGGNSTEAAESFWTQNSKVEDKLTIDVTVKSSWPLSGTRSPGFKPVTSVEDPNDGTRRISYEVNQGTLDKDFVFYYRLVDNIPGRVELIPYRASKEKPGSFMMVVTPGADLKKLDQGSDYLFILDKSGSMRKTIKSLNEAISKSLGQMKKHDRFRIFTFNDNTDELTSGWEEASISNVKKWQKKVNNIKSGGGTNLYKGISRPLRALDSDRVTSVVLVTDAVANQGDVDPKSFVKLMTNYDVRLFGFMIGNSGNWPLMRALCDASGGYYDSISNADDIIGKVLQAGEKVAYESMHDAKISFDGEEVYGLTNRTFKKIYRGQQLVIFGKYRQGGKASFNLNTRISGQKKEYKIDFELPEIALDNPEIERLWALSRIEQLDDQCNSGIVTEQQCKDSIRTLGVEYQLVTDETSMVVLNDRSFDNRKIVRRNQARTEVERTAQIRKASQPQKVAIHRVDNKSKSKRNFKFRAPSIGGGAVDPIAGLLILALGGIAGWMTRKPDSKE